MEAADLLCDSLFRWMENRKKCAEELLELAQELENVHQGSTSILAVTTAAGLTSAVFISIFTEGLALPLLAVAAGIVSIITGVVNEANSRSTFKKSIELIKEDKKVGMSIQKQLQDLKDRCGGAKLGDHADELECEVTTQLMGALARRDNTHIPLDFLRDFNRATVFRHMTPGGVAPAEASRFICQALNLISSPEITSSLKVSAKEMVENIGCIGIKEAVKAGSRVPSAIGLGICVYDLIVTCEELVKDNRVTEASKLLRDSAREILEGRQKLKEQLDAMQEIIQKLFQMKNLIKDLGEYSLSLTENGQNIMAYIMGTCTDNEVVSWLRELTHQIEFVNLLRFYLERLSCILPDLSTPDGDHIDIVFVAHGRIVDQFMPAGGLVPTPNITDTILYSPWNCKIDSNTAFGIAQGFIQVTDREFYNTRNRLYYEPNPLPDRWNSMRRSLHNIPGILLSPVTPEEGAWAFFDWLWESRSMEIEDRVIIPYVVPQLLVNAFGEIPLYIFIFVTSFMLMIFNKTATVHLAACLGRAGSPEKPVEWRTQYAFTSDETHMTVSMDDRYLNSMLFRALRSMFDSQKP
ncbi:uncharacterized protein LOC125267169 isoform X1 [Megalobrama amblycephala]|uniref:uncharacterized protein LOC125267169 isoform X1 n=1 Tax=Megalobrama amblycephala TaxID=75352 RepID=UPI00201403EA|nr:uncharacterized protein LOC125267169 isoform X1 [Megalobrama amblycephala]XP_048044488.1 uncharacterized protein LOC125267169 isoform X1 [Megalobrama amblycephala]XP_048044489.1 uncharacterized protein LOC125267169 isoform X1 [Megalobrama amblycephala]